jgi:hypothetical protein
MKLYLYFRWELGGIDLKFHGNCANLAPRAVSHVKMEFISHILEIVIVSIILGW